MTIRRHLKNFIKEMVRRASRFSPNSFKRLLLQILSEESYFFAQAGVKESLGASTEWVLKNLKNNGFSPATIIDAGAHVGDWTRMIKKIFPKAQVLMIEASPKKEIYLQTVRKEYPQSVDYAISLLGAESRTGVEFYEMGTGSSILQEQSNIPRDVLLLPMKTLDTVSEEKGFPEASFVKLDVQGYEIEVLRGAIKILQRATLVLLEVSFLQYNKDAPLIGEVVNFMNAHGFAVYDIGTLMRWGPDNTLLQGDLIFIKQDSPLRHKFFDFKIFTPKEMATDNPGRI